MKIYIIFLKYDEVQNDESFEWMQQNLYDSILESIHYINNERCLLYAYVDDKKMAEEFMSTRNPNKFVMITEKMSREEYKRLYKEYKPSLLSRYYFHHGKKDISLVLTEDEYGFYEGNMEWVEDEFDETVYAYPYMKYIFKIFKPKYQKTMKNFGIFDIFDICEALQIGECALINVNIVHFLLKWYRFTFI